MSGGQTSIKITVINDHTISEQSFDGDVVVVGREEGSPLRVNHADVSRRHLTITRRGHVLWLEDLGSANGTYINGEKVPANNPQVLKPGTKVQLGFEEQPPIIMAEIERVTRTSSKQAEATPAPKAPPPPPAKPKKAAPFEEVSSVSAAIKVKEEPAKKQTGLIHAAELEVEKILQRARREADEILKRARVGAQERYRIVFEEAQGAQQNAEDFYRDRVQEAYKAAEVLYEEARSETERIFENNTKICEEQRLETTERMADLRRKTKSDCESLIADAENVSKQLKEKRLAEAEAYLLRREQEIRQSVLDEMADDRLQHEKKMDTERSEHKEEFRLKREALELEMENLTGARDHLSDELDKIEVEYKDLHRTVSTLSSEKSFLNKVTKELSESRDAIDKETKELNEKSDQLQLDIKKKEKEIESLKTDIKKTNSEKEDSNKSLVSVQENLADLKKENSDLLAEHLGLKSKVGDFKAQEKKLMGSIEMLELKKNNIDKNFEDVKKNFDVSEKALIESKKELESLSRKNKELTEKRDAFATQIDKELADLKTHYERQKEKFKKDEEDHLAYLTMETSKRIQKVEKDFLSEISRRKSSVVKEIVISLETTSKVIGANLSGWRSESDQIEQNVQVLLEGQILNLKSEGGLQKINVVARRRMERFQNYAVSMVVTVVVMTAGFLIHGKLNGPSPLDRQVASETKARKDDLANRKFNPAKEADLKETYMDSVIYTDQFVDLYASDEYQKKWNIAATKHLLRLWKVDEDSSLKALSIASALVKSLQERKDKIHPDFVKDGLVKMKGAEDEALKRMSDVLGSPVRVESLRKFEREFFLRYRDRGEALDG